MSRLAAAGRWGLLSGLVALAGASWGHAEEAAPTRAMRPTSGSLQALLASSPQGASLWAGSLVQALQAYEANVNAQDRLKQARLQQDSIKTELTTATGTLELLTRQQSELEQQIKRLDQERAQGLAKLRSELEARLQEELSHARVQIDEELKRDYARSMQAFEARLGTLIDQQLTQEVEMQEREIQQLSKELETLTLEVSSRLSKLSSASEVAGNLGESVSRSIAQKQAELQTRREQLKVQRDQLMSQRRADFDQKLVQQQAVERQTRLMYKEANLRQAMAELLQNAKAQEDGALRQAKQALEDVVPRRMQAEKRQALLMVRLQALDQQHADAARQMETQEAARGESLVRFEQSFSRSNATASADGLSWLGQVIQQSPPDLATELTSIYHRIHARAQQERQLREQERLLRERQQALQVAREMERRFQVEQDRRMREQEAKARKADELMLKVREYQSTGQYDQALQTVTHIQMLNPALSSQLAIMQQELLTARDQATRQMRAGQVEKLFGQAMQAFEQGNYEHAVGLFEQVIAKETQLEQTP